MLQFSSRSHSDPPTHGGFFFAAKGFAEAKRAIDGSESTCLRGKFNAHPSELFPCGRIRLAPKRCTGGVPQLPLRLAAQRSCTRARGLRLASCADKPAQRGLPGTTTRGLRVRVSGSRPIPARPVRVRRTDFPRSERRAGYPPRRRHSRFPEQTSRPSPRRTCWTYPPQP